MNSLSQCKLIRLKLVNSRRSSTIVESNCSKVLAVLSTLLESTTHRSLKDNFRMENYMGMGEFAIRLAITMLVSLKMERSMVKVRVCSKVERLLRGNIGTTFLLVIRTRR